MAPVSVGDGGDGKKGGIVAVLAASDVLDANGVLEDVSMEADIIRVCVFVPAGRPQYALHL